MQRASTQLFRRAVNRRYSSHPSLHSFSEDEQALQAMVQKFAAEEIAPKVLEMDENQKMCPELIKKCFDLGLMGIDVSSDLGGGGLGLFGSVLVIEELAKIDPSVSVMVDVQNTLVNNSFKNYANVDLQQEYLPRLASKELGCFCLSEAGSGSDAFALKTTAEKTGDNQFTINGRKMWITNSGEADIFLVMANVDPSKGYKGITCFVVEKSNPGIKVGRKENKLGIRASSTHEVEFDNCVVTSDSIVGELGKGYKIAIESLNEGRIGIGAQMIGLAQGAFDAAVKYTKDRKQFGQPVANFQGMQHQQAQAATHIEAARLLVYNAARKKENGEDFIAEAAMAKLYSSQVAQQVSSQAVDWMGGVGFVKDYPLEKFYRDSKIGSIYEGTSNIQLTTIAKMVQARTA